MLRSLRLENFKNHAATEMDGLAGADGRGCMHVLVGPNGAGKSSILEALHYLHQLGARPGQHVFSGPRDPSHIARIGSAECSMRAVRSCGELVVRFRSDNEVWAPTLHLAEADGPPRELGASRWATGMPGNVSPSFRKGFSSAVYLRLRADRIATPSRSVAERPRVEFDGYATATVLADMLAATPERAEDVTEFVRAVVPGIERVYAIRRSVRYSESTSIQVDGTTVSVPQERTDAGHILAFRTTAGTVTADQASEGTLLVTALSVAMLADSVPPLVVLDDVETGLHPSAQLELTRLLRELAERNGGPQIFVTTHSPYVLDGVPPNHVWVVAQDDSGIAHVRRLSDHPRVEEARALLETGELWSTFGEDWVVNPAQAQ